MNYRHRGFTIVELLIAIVVITVLASISVVAYNGIQSRALNTARYTELKTWAQLFELYKAQEGAYPDMPVGGYCLGTGFPIGYGGVPRCRDYNINAVSAYIESDNALLMNEIKKVGSSLPSGPRVPSGMTVGPYVDYSSTHIRIKEVINGSLDDCPSDTTQDWTDGNGRTLCNITLKR